MFIRHSRTALPALLAGLVLGTAAHVAAAPIEIYLYDYAHVPSHDLGAAKRLVSSLYARSGVELRWADPSEYPQSSERRPFQMILLPTDMSAGKSAEQRFSGEVFGSANHDARRAYVFYSRVAQHARSSRSDLAVVLALVMAHELGHLLLPPGHSSSGLMKAAWFGAVTRLPSFTDAERLHLTAVIESN